MSDNIDPNYRHILENAKTILLVDWGNPIVPRSLLKAGFKVFGYSPNRYSVIELDTEGPDKEKLVFRKLNGKPGQVDVVNIYRPEDEHAGIITNHVLPLKAKVLWLQPPVMSAKTAALAKANGLQFVEGIDIAEVARTISSS
jgi:predicted CoA-binding protein